MSHPKFRFKEYQEEISKKKLGELSDIVRGSSPRPINDSKWFDKDSEVGWLRISDVTEQKGRIKNLEQRISLAGQEKTRVITTPHLLLSIAATVGSPVINYVPSGVHDGFLVFLNPKFDLEYMFQWFEYFKPQWRKYGQLGSQSNINSEIVRGTIINIPTLEEQQKIGTFLKTLDETIALHQQKLDSTKQLQKAMLQKMFPKKGEKIPEIRVKGFSEEWEEAKLGDYCGIARGTLPAKTSEVIGKYPFYNTGKKALQSNSYSINTDSSIIVSGHGSVGNIHFAKGKIGVSDGCYILDTNKLDIKFLYFTSKKYLSNHLNNKKTGTIISHTTKKDVERCKFYNPSLEEQEKIGLFFEGLEKTISLQENKLDIYKQFKKAMLQKMFV